MTPFEQALIMLALASAVFLIGFGLKKGIGWLWKKLKELGGPAAAGAAAAVVLLVVGHAATPQQQALARQQVEQLRAQGIEARVVTVDEDQARQLIEEARREGLAVDTHDPTPASSSPSDEVIVIRGDEDAVEDLDLERTDDRVLSDDERRYEEDVRRGFVSEMDW